MTFYKESAKRGFIHQVTDQSGIESYLRSNRGVAYIGFDLTAKSLHIGNLVQIMRTRLFQKMGHIPIILLGGATTKIGDPSGKDSQRQILDDKTISENLSSIKKVFSRYLDLSSVIFVNNSDWLEKLSYMDLLKKFGRHFSINRMLTFDSIRLRLDREQFLSFLEFNYIILQSYDFFHLYKEFGCRIQFGGSEQWGNIVSGIELIRKVCDVSCYGMTSPLITTASGAKMGKSEKGAIWLDGDLFTPYDYWQFWRNTDDLDVGRYLRLFTDLSFEEIERLEKLEGSKINDAKHVLADEATSLAHGKDVIPSIHKAAQTLFKDGNYESDCPSVYLKILKPITVEALFLQAGLVPSKSEFKRLVSGNGVKLNHRIIEDHQMLCDQFPAIASVGKKRHLRILIEE